MTSWITIIMAILSGALKIGYGLAFSHEETSISSGALKHSPPLLLAKKHNGHADNTKTTSGYQDDVHVQKVYFDSHVPLRINCTHPKEHRHIIWERADLVYPLAVGTHIFSPDARLSVHYLSVNLSQLIISNAIKEDAKLYRCRSARQKSPVCANDTCIEQNEAFELTFRAIFVIILGPQLAFYGMPLELICRANFSSPEAKRDPAISLEWYHNGVRRRASRFQSGGTFISSRWVDSNLLESRLLITWISDEEAGRWNCVERSRMNKQKLTNETGPSPSMSFDQLNLQIIAPSPLVAFATTTTSTNSEATNSRPSKFRHYLQLKGTVGGWRRTPSSSFSTKLVFCPCLSTLFILLNILFICPTTT